MAQDDGLRPRAGERDHPVHRHRREEERQVQEPLPFSDALGVTDPTHEVTNDELLRQLGGDPEDTLGQVASFGIGLGTDPLTYAGGAIARRLFGGYGGLTRTGQAAADDAAGVYRLGDPMDHAVESLGGRAAAAGDEAAELAGKAEAPGEALHAGEMFPGADAPMPGGELITRLPMPRDYGHLMGVDAHGVYSPESIGIPADVLADTGNRSGAFATSLGTWDQVLGDLDRLHPVHRAALKGGETGPAFFAEEEWRRLLRARLDDLQAVRELGTSAAVPGFESLLPKIASESDRIHAHLPQFMLSGWGNKTAGKYAVEDIMNGVVKPSEAVAYMAENAPHLPFDEAGLRRMAATGQEQQLKDQLREALDYLAGGTFNPLSEIRPHMGDELMAHELSGILNPEALAATGIEPNIVRSLLADPARQTPQVREALALLEQLRAARG